MVNGKRYNNREFSFQSIDGNPSEVELIFVRTLFRKGAIVTDEYTSVSSIPKEVREGLQDEGITVVGVA